MTVSIHVIPRSPKSAIAGTRGDALLIRLKAAPVDGAANEALVDLLSKRLGRPRRHITVVAGKTSRHKRVRIEGLTDAEFAARLSAILNENPTE